MPAPRVEVIEDQDTAPAPSNIRKRGYPRKSSEVLEAAERVFLASGYALSSMDEIADAAGVSKRTVYSNFNSKEDLFSAVIRKRCAEVVPNQRAFDRARKEDLENGLKIIATDFLRNILKQAQVELYQTVMAAARSRPEIGRTMFEGPLLQSQHLIAAYLAEHVASGTLRISDPEAAAAQFIAMIKTNMHMAMLFSQPAKISGPAIKASAAACVRVFLYGYVPR